MKDQFAKFPEVLLMDATYCINNKGMPLIIFMCTDGYGNGCIVAYCFIADERQDTVKRAIGLFCSFNANTQKETKTVIVDKDYNEITGIASLLPCASIQLCRFHVSKVFKCETKNEPIESRDNVRHILQSLIYCGSRESYTKYYDELVRMASPRFLQYFHKNWHHCKQAWCNWDRVSRQ